MAIFKQNVSEPAEATPQQVLNDDAYEEYQEEYYENVRPEMKLKEALGLIPPELKQWLDASAKYSNLPPKSIAEFQTIPLDADFLLSERECAKFGLSIPEDAEKHIFETEEKQSYFTNPATGEIIPLAQATPADMEKVLRQEYPIVQEPAVKQEIFYAFRDLQLDSSITNSITEQYTISLLQAHEPVQTLISSIEAAGIPVSQVSASHIPAATCVYLEETNELLFGKNGTVSEQLDSLCSGYAQALVKCTSTQPPDINRFEIAALDYVMHQRLDIEYTNTDGLQELQQAHSNARHNPSFDIGKAMERVHKQAAFITQKVRDYRVILPEQDKRAPGMEQLMEKLGVAQNLMENL